MKRWMRTLILAGIGGAAALQAAVSPHIGYVYPAGAVPGSTVQIEIGGQYIRDFAGVHMDGLPVTATVKDYLRIYDQKEAGALRRAKETFEARMEEASNEQIRQRMQKRLDEIDQELSMVMQVRRADRMNPGMAAKKQFNPQIAERITLEAVIPETAIPGSYELRVITTNGLSNPLLFQIGSTGEVQELEPNDKLSGAENIAELPVVINGQILPGDVDSFRFQALKGQKLVCRVSARELIPYLADAVPGWFQAVLTLYDAAGREVAYDDDYRSGPDPVILYDVPENGEYTLAIRDSIYRGREDFVYRISIGELPFIERIFPLGGPAGQPVVVSVSGVNLPSDRITVETERKDEEVAVRMDRDGLFSNVRPFAVSPFPEVMAMEPDNRKEQAIGVTNSTVINGLIGTPGDQDWFFFEGRRGQRKQIEVYARRLGSPLDARLFLLDANQQIVAVSDDVPDRSAGLLTHQADARLDVTLPESGLYFVRLVDLLGKGSDAHAYRLYIGDELPDVQLRIVPASLRVPRGGTAMATVHVIRSGGFSGEVVLSTVDAPEGVRLQRAVIPAGEESTQIIISASSRIPDQIVPLEIAGTADCGWRTVRRRVVPAEDMMQAFIYRHLVEAGQFMLQVTEPDPVSVVLKLPRSGVIRARPGSEVMLGAEIVRRDGGRGVVNLTLADAPEWVTLGASAIGGLEGQNAVYLKISSNAEAGESATFLLNGSSRILSKGSKKEFTPVLQAIENRDFTFAIDAIHVEIIN